MIKFNIGDNEKIDVTVLDNAGYEDMRRFNGKRAVVCGIGNVLSGLVQVQIKNKFVLFQPNCLSVV